MIRKITKSYSMDAVLALMNPIIQKWFRSKFKTLTEPQSYAIPLIHRGENTLVCSPTGSGKTMTAFLSILNELFILHTKGRLENKIYCVYVSPLRALANDINRNLMQPLREITALATEDMAPPQIRVGVRTGDTPASERQKMLRSPPHIFITTPESLALVLSTRKFRENFRSVKWVVIDEIHEISASKRGVFLSLTLERLQEYVQKEIIRIGLSATQAPIEEIGKFLVGFNRAGRLRSLNIVEIKTQKRLDLQVLCPARDITALPFEIVNSLTYDIIKNEIEKHRTTLVFTNTRSGAEAVTYKLKERGIERVETHHGSLSRLTRLNVEEELKRGNLSAVVSSTSLELGIDIGFIELVCQLGSPKSIAKGLQRIGRAGHAYGAVSKGRLIVTDTDDLVECAVLAKNAYDYKIDRVQIPKNCLDVLAQTLVGMSLEKRWNVEEAYRLVRRSYCYHWLSRKDFLAVLNYLGESKDRETIYSKIRYYSEDGVFGIKKGGRMIYFLNLGTIPEEADYHVFSLNTGTHLGELSEPFVERLTVGDIFVLGGKTYEFMSLKGTNLYVRDALGRKPTVPSWTGEMLPRSFDLSVEIGKFRALLNKKLDIVPEKNLISWLIREYHVDEGCARSIISYFREQRTITIIPTNKELLIEGYIGLKGEHNIIFHYCFGRRVNDALARAYAYALSQMYNCNFRISVTDDNFMLTTRKEIPLESSAKIVSLVTPENIDTLLHSAVKNTELFKQRFRHCATRAFMILRNYKGKEVSVSRQQSRSTRLIDFLLELQDFPVICETYNEILNIDMDLENARSVIAGIANGTIKVYNRPYSSVPSPFAHGVILAGISDIILMEDRTALLKELHRQVLARVTAELPSTIFDKQTVRNYFDNKFGKIRAKDDIVRVLSRAGPLELFREKGPRSIYRFSHVTDEELRKFVLELINSGALKSISFRAETYWLVPEHEELYCKIYQRMPALSVQENIILQKLKELTSEESPEGITSKQLAKMLALPIKTVAGTIRKLELSNLVYRRKVLSTEIYWCPRAFIATSSPEDLQNILARIVAKHLELSAPLTLPELVFELALTEEKVRPVLAKLQQSGVVAEGYFTVATEPQYMLSSDLAVLEHRMKSGEKEKIFSYAAVKQYIIQKQFRPVKDIRDYFQTFGESSYLFDIFNRVEKFDLETWKKLRREGAILEGRFIRERVKYIRREDADLYASVYRSKIFLDALDTKILSLLRHTDGMTVFELTERLDVDSKRVKESVEKLDRNLYLIRSIDNDMPSINRYILFEPSCMVENAESTVVYKYIAAFGPVTISSIRHYTGFDYGLIETVLSELESQKKVARIVVADNEEMYVLRSELIDLEATLPAGDRMRILSLFDPYVHTIQSELESRYDEGWYFPVIKDGALCGRIEKWEVSGCIEIRDIELDEPALLSELLTELDRIMNYHNAFGYDLLKIKKVFGKEPDELGTELIAKFESFGYHKVQNMLVKGNFVPVWFSEDDFYRYLLWKQHIHPENRLEGMMECVSEFGGVRSEFEAALRTRKSETLKPYQKAGKIAVCRPIPDFATYCTYDDMLLYKKAKNFALDKNMKAILNIFIMKKSIRREVLFDIAPLGRGSFVEAMEKLIRGLYIFRASDGKYQVTEELKMSVAEAREKVLRRIISSFGIISAEKLAICCGFEYGMAELRRWLQKFVLDGFLVKGFLVEGSDKVYWIVKEDLEKFFVRTATGFCVLRNPARTFKLEFVLTPFDRLFPYLADKIKQKFGFGSCYVIFRGPKMVGAFRARKLKNELLVLEFIGGRDEREILKNFARKWNLRLREKKEIIAEFEEHELV